MAGNAPAKWKINLPTRVIWGEKDPALLLGNLYGLSDYVASFDVQVLPNATHWVVHEESERVNALIGGFCGTHVPP